jgi:hypothetical protein
MNKVTMEQREAIVREAIAKRDAIAAGQLQQTLTDEQINSLIDATADPAALGTMAQRLYRLARAVEQQLAGAWRAIESAPRDADAIWLFVDGAVVRGVWCEQEFREHRDADGNYLGQQDADAFWMNLDDGSACDPTLWQPIVKPAVPNGVSASRVDTFQPADADDSGKGRQP